MAPFKIRQYNISQERTEEREKSFNSLISVTGVMHFVLKSVQTTIARGATRMFSSWEHCFAGDDKLRHSSFLQPIPQDSPWVVSLPHHALSVTVSMTLKLHWEQGLCSSTSWYSCTGNLHILSLCFCASVWSFLPWYTVPKGRIHLISCRCLLWDSY